MLSLDGFDAIVIVLLLAVAFAGLFAARWVQRKNAFDVANAFSGGVFVAAGLIHLLADAIEDFPYTGPYPWPFTACVGGFFLVYFLDCVVRAWHFAPPPMRVEILHEASCNSESDDPLLVPTTLVPPSVVGPYVLLTALSGHSFISGVALGVEDQLRNVLILCFAIAVHKGVAAMALFTTLLQTGGMSMARRVRLFTIFALSTPLGIVMGLVLRHSDSSANRGVAAVVQAVAAGSFLYVAIVEIMGSESIRTSRRHPLLLFAYSFFGFLIMAAVAIET